MKITITDSSLTFETDHGNEDYEVMAAVLEEWLGRSRPMLPPLPPLPNSVPGYPLPSFPAPPYVVNC